LIEATLTRIQAEQVADPEAVLLMLALPLERGRMETESRPRSWLRPFRPRHDFIRQQHVTWDQYEQALVLPTLAEVMELRRTTAATILPHITYPQFRSQVSSGRYSVIFLLAHHAPGDTIEFSDGMVSWEKVRSTLKRTARPLSFIFFVCTARAWQKELFGNAKMGSTAAPDTLVWAPAAVELARLWIQGLDGSRTVSEAYNRALVLWLGPQTGCA